MSAFAEMREMNPPGLWIDHIDNGIGTALTVVARAGHPAALLAMANKKMDKVSLVATSYHNIAEHRRESTAEDLRRSIRIATTNTPLNTSDVIPFGLDMVQTTWAIRSMVEGRNDVNGYIVSIAPGLSIEVTPYGNVSSFANGQDIVSSELGIYVTWTRTGTSGPVVVDFDTRGSYCIKDILNFLVTNSKAHSVHEYQKCEMCNTPIHAAYQRSIGSVTSENVLAVILMRQFHTCTSCAVEHMKSMEATEEYEREGSVPNL